MGKESIQQKRAFEFLFAKFKTQETFNKEEFRKATGWSGVTFDTYWSKQYETLLRPESDNQYRVSEVFRRFITWEKFRTHITQNRRISVDYTILTYDNVILFDFFMPLTNEGYLRTSLDALFYKDSILGRLRILGKEKLRHHFEPKPEEKDKDYFEKICRWVSDKFGGYSISHVSGRFRDDELKTMLEAYKTIKEKGQYLVDETTAIVRFIFPCGDFQSNKFLSTKNYFEELALDKEDKKTREEASLIRWLFYELFVRSIVEVVDGEDEIWMLESGIRNKLHIWRVQK